MGERFRARAYEGGADLERVIAERIAFPAPTHRERYPAVGRLRLLVASRLYEPLRNARVWEDEAGTIVGFAALLQRQIGGTRLSLERTVAPPTYGSGLEGELLAWARRRVAEIAEELRSAVTLDVAVGEDDAEERARLAGAGFHLLDSHPLYLARDLTQPRPEPASPRDVTLRPLAGTDELEPYTALYDATFTPIAPDYRRHLLADAGHVHLVAVTGDGEYAAFCECGVQPEEWEHLGARAGWIEYVGAAPSQQRRGLGYAVTLAGLRWLRGRGCDTAMLVTGEGNATARRLYERLGFRVVAREDVWQVTVKT